MAPESCNLDKDDAEILKPSSTASSTSPSPSPATSSSPPTLFLKSPTQDYPIQRHERSDIQPADTGAAVSAPKPAGEESLPVPGIPKAGKDTVRCSRKLEGEERQLPVRSVNRCSSCNKRVGLTGFRCRCGDLFCPGHRYSDTHDCSFDYKAAGREEIAKANPVVRAAKIIKI